MRDILSRRERPTLAALAAARVLVAFDFDGTLVPFGSRPDRARLRAVTRRLLTRLARRARCAVISGRARRDLLIALDGAPVVAAVGNHGAEPAGRARPPRAVATWRKALARRLAGTPGVWIEDKGFSLSVHYRESTRKAAVRRAVLRAASRLKGATVFGGRDVVNIVPRGAPDKGRALDRLLLRAGRPAVVYVGDDETDESAFARARAAGGLAIRVGRSRQSRASHFVRSQSHIDALLRRLIRVAAREGAR